MLAVAHSSKNAVFWQWMRVSGDVAFALGALLMAADFTVKLGPLYPSLARHRQLFTPAGGELRAAP